MLVSYHTVHHNVNIDVQQCCVDVQVLAYIVVTRSVEIWIDVLLENTLVLIVEALIDSIEIALNSFRDTVHSTQ